MLILRQLIYHLFFDFFSFLKVFISRVKFRSNCPYFGWRNPKSNIISDAGFGTPWFKAVQGLGWDYVGRIRGNKYYRLQNSLTWAPITSLHKDATATPTLLGEIELCKEHGFKTTLYRYKGKALGRKNKTKRGKIKQTNQSKKHAKANKEPWLLVSSLLINSKTAKKVVEIYSFRMQIEEGFRDLKSTK